MNDYLQNKWLDGKVHFTTDALPQWLQNFEGITPLDVTLEPRVGTETALFIIDRTPFVEQLKRVKPFTLNLKTGIVRTSQGLIVFLLFYVPNPNALDKMFAGWDTYINPFEPYHLEIFRKLARQTHWHLLLIGANDEIIDFYEFENTYGLEKTLEQAQQLAKGESQGSFDLVREEFMQTYSIADLFDA